MVSPVKAFIDPTTVDRLSTNTTVCASAFPGRLPVWANVLNTVMQIDGPQHVRFSICALFFNNTVGKSISCISPMPLSSPATNYKIATFSPIYQERGASVSRGTEGQLYPVPF